MVMKSINLMMMVLALLVLGAGLSFAQEEPNLVVLELPGYRRGYEGRVREKPPACCDDCFCIEQECKCSDYWRGSCPDNCKNCGVLPPRLEPPFVQCEDVFPYTCGPRCSHSPLQT